MACRSCGAALRRNGIQIPSITNFFPPRNFSTGTRRLRHGGLPVFSETSSSELDSILSTLRYKVFLPNAHLNQQQRKLIFREKYRSQLESQPVTITVGDEEIELEHFDPHSLPKTWELTRRAFELLGQEGQAKDWRKVVPGLMHGFRQVGFGMNSARVEKMVQMANDAGMQDVVMNCLREVKSTGVSLRHSGVRYEVLWGVHTLAQNRGKEAWSDKYTKQAANRMKQLAMQLESRDHGGGHLNSSRDPRVSPAVIGLLLELNAVRAYRHLGGMDSEGKVRMYAERLMDALSRWEGDEFADAPYEGQKYVFRIIIWQALSLAHKVLGAEMPRAEAAREKMNLVEEQIHEQLTSDLSSVRPQFCIVRMKEAWDKRVQEI